MRRAFAVTQPGAVRRRLGVAQRLGGGLPERVPGGFVERVAGSQLVPIAKPELSGPGPSTSHLARASGTLLA